MTILFVVVICCGLTLEDHVRNDIREIMETELTLTNDIEAKQLNGTDT
jgi:hypothetical protein